MNPFLEALRAENNFSLERLKELYRVRCRETHPDLSHKESSEFIQVRKDYEEAMESISSGNIPEETPFEELLELFAVRGLSRSNAEVLDSMIALLQISAPEGAELFKAYQTLFFETYPQWAERGTIFYTHGLFLAAVRQAVLYQNEASARALMLFHDMARDLEIKVKSRRVENGEILASLINWLGKKIHVE